MNPRLLDSAKSLRSISRRTATLAVAVIISATSLAQTAEDAPLTIFVGTELNLILDDDAHKISGFENKELQVQVGSEPISLPPSRVRAIEIRRAPKISRAYAEISELSFEPKYSPQTDPELAWRNSISEAQAHVKSGQDYVHGQAILKTMEADNFGDSEAEEIYAQGLANVEEAATRTERIADLSHEMPGGLDTGMYDAIDLRVTLSCSEPLKNPYLVVLVQYQEPEDTRILTKPVFQEIDEPLSNPSQIKVFSTGFPPGYTLIDAAVLLFDQGREIATELSEKQASVTQDQALMYLRFTRKNETPSGSLNPAPIEGFVPSGFLETLSPEVRQASVRVTVNPEGRILDISGDRGVLSADVESLIRQIPFYPALQDGEAIQGELLATVGELLR